MKQSKNSILSSRLCCGEVDSAGLNRWITAVSYQLKKYKTRFKRRARCHIFCCSAMLINVKHKRYNSGSMLKTSSWLSEAKGRPWWYVHVTPAPAGIRSTVDFRCKTSCERKEHFPGLSQMIRSMLLFTHGQKNREKVTGYMTAKPLQHVMSWA